MLLPRLKKLPFWRVLQERWPTFLVVLAFLLLFGQAVRRGFAPGMPAYGDAFSFPLTVDAAFVTFRSAWDVRNPGMDLPVASVLSFLTIFEALAGALAGGNMIFVARLFYFYLPLPLLFVSMYWFLGKLSLYRPAKFLAAFIYAVNFFTIGEVLGGFPGTNYVQALFPVLLFSLYHRRWLVFSLLFSVAYIFSDHVILISVPFFLLFLILGFLRGGFWGLVKNALFILSSAVLVILLTLPYTYYYFKVSLPFLGGPFLREEVLAFLVRNVHDTYRYYTLGNALRLGGSSYAALFGGDDAWSRVGFIIPVLAFAWVFFPANRRGRQVKIGLLFTSLALVILALLYATHRFWSVPLFVKFPFLFRFRNPARLTLFLALAYAPLIALTLDGLGRWLSSKLSGKAGLVLSGAVMVGIFLPLSYYLKPFYTGDYHFSQSRGTNYTIGDRYYTVKNWLERERKGGGSFRTLWLPYNHEEVEIKIRYIEPLAYAVPINYGAYADNEYLFWMKRSYLKMSLGDYSVLDDLALAGVKYLILNEASRDSGPARFEYDYLTPWLPGGVDNWRKIILSLPGVKYRESLAGFAFYENPRYSPEKVIPVLAGYPPSDISYQQRRKDILIVISGFTWLAVLGALFFPRGPVRGEEDRCPRVRQVVWS